jgi:hypothetical protein
VPASASERRKAVEWNQVRHKNALSGSGLGKVDPAKRRKKRKSYKMS